jgi:uncharacterized membrane protein YecN with MAPEG domain
MSIAIVCTALLGLLLFGLGLNVSIARRRHAKGIGYDSGVNDPVHRAVRAHGNTAEYAPFLAVLFLWHAAHDAPAWINAVIVAVTAARMMLVAGLLWGGPLHRGNALRFVGALLTYIGGLVLAAALLVA